MDIDFLKTVGLWNSLNELIGETGWIEFLSLTFPICEPLSWEFFSSLVVDWNACFQQGPIYIKF